MTSYNSLKKLLFLLPPESAHRLAELYLKALPYFSKHPKQDLLLSQNICGLEFANPIGLAGGFDKNATMIRGLACSGFGHIELGTITLKPQSGNPPPRLFRHARERALQNAMGFNNHGALVIAGRIRALLESGFSDSKIPLGINIGKNKDVPLEDALLDYERCLRVFVDSKKIPKKASLLGDFFVFNLSSPNTPNLRKLQNASFVSELLAMAKSTLSNLAPVFLKISPDIEINEMLNLCDCAVMNGVDGLIATNTTIDYSLISKPALAHNKPFGGISGAVLGEKSRQILKILAQNYFGKTALISTGGIMSARDIYERLRIGANMVQIYTSFIYQGPNTCKKLNKELSLILREDGFSSIKEVIGVDL